MKGFKTVKEFQPTIKVDGKKFYLYDIEYFTGDMERVAKGIKKDGINYRILKRVVKGDNVGAYVFYINKQGHKNASYYRNLGIDLGDINLY